MDACLPIHSISFRRFAVRRRIFAEATRPPVATMRAIRRGVFDPDPADRDSDSCSDTVYTLVVSPTMNRCLAAVVSSFAIALAGAGHASNAAASPPSDDADSPSCVYTMSAPQVVSVSGVAMVTATLKPFPCTGHISPNSLTICIEPQGSAPQCAFRAVPEKAEAFVPYTPGTTYITSGTGCGSVYTTQGSICASVGPYSTTL
jgi:hypothetical protein